MNETGSDNSCNAKEGNPFGPFWDTFNIDFVSSEFYGPLHYDTYHHDMAQKWNDKYPPAKWSVLAFSGKNFLTGLRSFPPNTVFIHRSSCQLSSPTRKQTSPEIP